MDRKTPLIIITGPTASGKTGLVLELAKIHPIEVISADSMQIYRHMNIATAKPDADELAALPHHLIDIIDPDEEFNAGMFASLAKETISDVLSKHKVPIVVGGTGLYLKALVYGLVSAPEPSRDLRRYFQGMLSRKGRQYLWGILDRLDPAASSRIPPNDSVRVIRCLEIVFLTGMRPSTLQGRHGFSQSRYRTHLACIMPERTRLYETINDRVYTMIEKGLVDETRHLLEMGFSTHLRSMQTLAYKHVLRYLSSKITSEEMIQAIQRDTRHYAKRQITWIRSHNDPCSFYHCPEDAYKDVAGWIEAVARP